MVRERSANDRKRDKSQLDLMREREKEPYTIGMLDQFANSAQKNKEVVNKQYFNQVSRNSHLQIKVQDSQDLDN